MHLLQVCNVGEIMGGTAACAWSLTRSLPDWKHSIAFLTPIRPTTREAFHPHTLIDWSPGKLISDASMDADLIILHNIGPGRLSLRGGRPTIQYVHSIGRRIEADQTVYCSEWLATQCARPREQVLWQGVPIPQEPFGHTVRGAGPLRIGRICTPSRRKWPESLVEFYAVLASRHPNVQWEFVGCPDELRSKLLMACQLRAVFQKASWGARSAFWKWDALLYHHPTLVETFGRTAAEAARAGCIPIVDDCGGFQEQLRVLGGFGCRSIQDFSAALTQLADVTTRIKLATTLQQRAEAHFSLRAFRERILRAYAKIQGRSTSFSQAQLS